jgi:hypothetical protein
MTARQNPIEALAAARMLRTEAEVEAFDRALGELAERADASDLPSLLRVFTDATEDPSNVMWGLLHHVEDFEPAVYAEAFVECLPATLPSARAWMTTFAIRQLNVDEARALLVGFGRRASPVARGHLVGILTEIAAYPQAVGGRAREALEDLAS